MDKRIMPEMKNKIRRDKREREREIRNRTEEEKTNDIQENENMAAITSICINCSQNKPFRNLLAQ